MLKPFHEINRDLKLRYTKQYLGMELRGAAYNFVGLVPQKTNLVLRFRHPKDADLDQRLAAEDLETSAYNKPWEYGISLTPNQFREKRALVKDLGRLAYEYYTKG